MPNSSMPTKTGNNTHGDELDRIGGREGGVYYSNHLPFLGSRLEQ